jgi:CheY-like chemotaxis protein
MSGNNLAFGVPIHELDVVLVEPSKSMQTIMRSVLLAIKVSRVRIFDSANDALRSMHSKHPHVLLTDLQVGDVTGIDLIKLIRRPDLDPLCHVPVVVITGNASRATLSKAIEAGAHHIMAKPVSPSAIQKILTWLTQDNRMLEEIEGRMVIPGTDKILEAIAKANERSANQMVGSDDDGVNFRRTEATGGAGDDGLKFKRNEAGEGSDGLQFSRQAVGDTDDGLKFDREGQGDDKTKAPSSETPMPDKSNEEASAGGNDDATGANSDAPDRPERKRRAFAQIAK